MPVLTGLANEILAQIINATSAGDIASLASCCKRLHILAQKRLAFHKKQRDEAGRIVVGWGPWLSASAIHPLKHLQDILDNDDVRYYTRDMEIGLLSSEDPNGQRFWYAGTSLEKEREAMIANIGSQYSIQISALVAKVYGALSPYASKTDLKKWTNKVICGEKAAVVILLLALYPYLESLEIHKTDQDWVTEEMSMEERDSIPLARRKDDTWGNLFRSLTATAIVPVNNKLGIFSRLSEFQFLCSDDEPGMGTSALMLLPFMALPTMRKVVGLYTDARNLPWSYDTGTSRVTNLDLQGDHDTASLLNLIRGIKRLEIFRYQFVFPHEDFVRRAREGDPYRLKWGPRADNDAAAADPDKDSPDESDEDRENPGEVDLDRPTATWEPRAITRSLMQYARDSLVSLHLAAISFTGVEKLSRDEPFIDSLRSFGALKYVFLDTMMLFKRVKWTRNVPVVGGSSIQQFSWEEIRAQRLVDFLPESIGVLTMTCQYVGRGLSKTDVGQMFTGLPKLKNRLPKLADISFVWMPEEDRKRLRNPDVVKEGWEELRSRCNESEIEISYSLYEGAP